MRHSGKPIEFQIVVACTLAPPGTIEVKGLAVGGLPAESSQLPVNVLAATLLQVVHATLLGKAEKQEAPRVVVPGMMPPPGVPGMG